MTRILITSRDHGAYAHLSAIARTLVAQGEDVLFILSEAKLGTRDVDGEVRTETLADGPFASLSDVPDLIRRQVERTLTEFDPEVVVVGLADRVEIAVDELFFAAAAGRVPVVAMQDFWGERKLVGDHEADHYLVIDAIAARVTATSAPCHVIGSPKHAAYAQVDRPALRHSFRVRLGVSDGAPLIGYFGQGLHDKAGYLSFLADLAHTVANLKEGTRLLYRPHPRETAAEIAESRRILAASGRLLPAVEEAAIEPWLLGADVILSCFSTCGFDALHLNRLDTVPWSTVVYADHVPSIAAHWRHDSGLDMLPPVDMGAAMSTAQSSLAAALTSAFDPDVRARLQAATLLAIPDPCAAPQRTAGIIVSIAAQAQASRGRAQKLTWSLPQ